MARLWERAIARGTRDGSCGTSTTRHGAMDALSRTSVDGRKPAHGHVASVNVVDGALEAFYLRTLPAHSAATNRGQANGTNRQR
jgi:hypothetical protein